MIAAASALARPNAAREAARMIARLVRQRRRRRRMSLPSSRMYAGVAGDRAIPHRRHLADPRDTKVSATARRSCRPTESSRSICSTGSPLPRDRITILWRLWSRPTRRCSPRWSESANCSSACRCSSESSRALERSSASCFRSTIMAARGALGTISGWGTIDGALALLSAVSLLLPTGRFAGIDALRRRAVRRPTVVAEVVPERPMDGPTASP